MKNDTQKVQTTQKVQMLLTPSWLLPQGKLIFGFFKKS